MANCKKNIIRAAALMAVVTTAAGCLPLTAPTIIGLAVDGFSFMTTGKTITDHALSQVAQRDCSIGRAVFTGSDVCFADDEQSVIAFDDVHDDTQMLLTTASGSDNEAQDALPVGTF